MTRYSSHLLLVTSADPLLASPRNAEVLGKRSMVQMTAAFCAAMRLPLQSKTRTSSPSTPVMVRRDPSSEMVGSSSDGGSIVSSGTSIRLRMSNEGIFSKGSFSGMGASLTLLVFDYFACTLSEI